MLGCSTLKTGSFGLAAVGAAAPARVRAPFTLTMTMMTITTMRGGEG